MSITRQDESIKNNNGRPGQLLLKIKAAETLEIKNHRAVEILQSDKKKPKCKGSDSFLHIFYTNSNKN